MGKKKATRVGKEIIYRTIKTEYWEIQPLGKGLVRVLRVSRPQDSWEYCNGWTPEALRVIPEEIRERAENET